MWVMSFQYRYPSPLQHPHVSHITCGGLETHTRYLHICTVHGVLAGGGHNTSCTIW